MKPIRLTLTIVVIVMLFSVSAMFYCQVAVSIWFQNHKPSQGMPINTTFKIIHTIAQPAYWLKEALESKE